ncbi:olfactory receptor 1K1-like isoform 2-T2 [Menidia menidia]
MENYTFDGLLFKLQGLQISPANRYPAFIFLLCSYLFILVANVGIVILIWSEKSLHQPMYILFCSLSINDIMGNSVLAPRLLASIVVPPPELVISYSECVLQAFGAHMYGINSHTVLMVMAFDSIVLTYSKIAAVCLTSKSQALNSKALKTCSTHLSLYLLMLVSGIVFITMHRFPHLAEYRKVSVALFNVVPGCLNPVIYGLQSQEIQACLSNMFRLKKVKPAI